MSTPRLIVSRWVLACLLASSAIGVQAQSYPKKPLRIVVPFGAGGVADLTGQKRNAALPQVPTAQEGGVPNLVSTSWNGLGVPAKTPQAVVLRLNKEVNAALQNPAVRQKLLELNVEPHPSSVPQAQAWLQTEIKRWGDVIQRAGIQKQ
jgi:tripartite-type tricarboxylate transporter receptor subunit TctC